MAASGVPLQIGAAVTDPTNPPTVAFTAANRPYLVLDDSTDEPFLFTFRMPENYASAPVAKMQYSMGTATSGNVILAVEVMAVTDAEDIDTDSFDTANTSSATAVPGTAGLMDEISLSLTNADSLAAGDYIALRVRRDADNASDTATGDMEFWAMSLEYTTT